MLRQAITYLSTGPRKYLTIIFACALPCRLALFMLMLSGVDNEVINNASPDVTKYMFSAQAIASQFDFKTDAVYIFGPGYPAFLAVLKLVFGDISHSLVFVQIILGAIGSVLLAKLAFKLTDDIRITIIAGMLNALSIVSISLANTLLSETLFFVLVLAGFLSFVTALERDKVLYSTLAAVCLGAAALTRSLGQFLFVILVLMSVTLYPVPNLSRWRLFLKRLKHLIPAAAIIAVILGGWVIRNNEVYGSPTLAGAGPEGIAKIGFMLRAEQEGVSFWDILGEVRAEVKQVERETDQGEQVWIKYARETSELARKHPIAIARIYLRNVIGNANTDWGMIYYVNLLKWRNPAGRMSGKLEKKGLNYRVSLFALIGLVMLIRKRRYSLAVILVCIYGYFALVAGFAADQGMRIFYPGQIAWSMLVASPLLGLYDWVKNYRDKKRLQRATTD